MLRSKLIEPPPVHLPQTNRPANTATLNCVQPHPLKKETTTPNITYQMKLATTQKVATIQPKK